MTDWTPNWEQTPAPKGDDEDQARRMYEREMSEMDRVDTAPAWSDLHEWQREAWRRELREGEGV